MCSTPFGINGRNTIGHCGSRFESVDSAQRLSASTEGTPRTVDRAPSAVEQCSTPFGINGRNTVARASRRHRGCRCAQRLSASTEGTRAAATGPPGGTVRVLNAFRHQRKEHAVMPPTAQLHWLVLNAFRHQRKEHCASRRIAADCRTCAQRLSASTEGTQPQTARLVRPTVDVLNAFRHQRKEHIDLARQRLRPCIECSTPFGINGRNTTGDACGTMRLVRCSTPFGINGRNTCRDVNEHQHGIVCSTPFGINGRNTRASAIGAGQPVSAQRLSASTEGTRHSLATPDSLPGYEATFQASPRQRAPERRVADRKAARNVPRRRLQTLHSTTTYADAAAIVKHLPDGRHDALSMDANTLRRRFAAIRLHHAAVHDCPFTRF